MKKGFIFCVLYAICINVLAEETAYFRLVLSSKSGTFNEMNFAEDDDFTDAYENGDDVEKIMTLANSKSVLVYGFQENKKCESVVTNQLEGQQIGIVTNKVDEEYTITFSNVEGRELKMLDAEEDSIVVIGNTTSYKFTAVKDKTIADRFSIYKTFVPDPGELSICHQYGEIAIYNNPFTSKIVVKDKNGNVVIKRQPQDTPQFISLEHLSAGLYTIEMNEGTKVFTIMVQ